MGLFDTVNLRDRLQTCVVANLLFLARQFAGTPDLNSEDRTEV
jgi:hypothetical protein